MKSTRKLILLVFVLFALAASAHAADDSPLHNAVGKGDKAEVEALLSRGADVNTKGQHGYTALGWAAALGEKDIADLLLSKGADVNAKTMYGYTPLHSAAHFGRQSIAECRAVTGQRRRCQRQG